MNRTERNNLVLEHLPLVGFLVSDACAKSRYLSRADLTSVGSEALIHCVESFDSARGVPFTAYARIRINGALIDEMRRQDWAPKGSRRKMKDVEETSDILSVELGRTPTVDEIAAALGIDASEARAVLANSARTVSSLDEVIAHTLPAAGHTPEEASLEQEANQHLRTAVASLPERMRFVVEQVYLEDRPVKEVADELGCSHAAVSQHRAEGIRMLRDAMALTATGPEPRQMHSRVAPARLNAYLSTVADRTAGGLTRPGIRVARAA